MTTLAFSFWALVISAALAHGAYLRTDSRRLVKHESESELRSRADVTIMLEAAYPPFSDYDAVDGLVGFDVELVPLVCKAAGITCAVVTAPFKTAWPGHENAFMGEGFLNNHFDCASASGNTMPRRSTLKFSHPYTKEVVGAFVANRGETMAEDGSDVHIGTVEGFSCGKAFLQRTMPDVKKVTEFPNTGDLFDALSDGTVQVAFTCPLASAKDSMDKKKHKIIRTAKGFNEGLAFMCRPEVEAKIFMLNSGIKKIRENGKLKKLCEDYPEVRCEFQRKFNALSGGVSDVRYPYMTIMMEAAYPPFNDYDPVDGLVGFDVELVPLVCSTVGVTCAVVTAPFKRAWPNHENAFMGEGFLNREFDCVAASGNTMPRRSTLKFSNPYTKEVVGAFVANKGEDMAEDGSDVHIGTIEGFSCGKAYLLRTMPDVKKVTEFPSTGELFDALSDGSVQVALTCPLASAKDSMDEERHEIIRTAKGFNEGLAFMCHPDVASKVALLNNGIEKLRENGELRKLCEEHRNVNCDFHRRFNTDEGGVDNRKESRLPNEHKLKARHLHRSNTRSSTLGHVVATTAAIMMMAF